MKVENHPDAYRVDSVTLSDNEGARVGHNAQIAVHSLGKKPQLSPCTHPFTSTVCRPSREK
jgi:hypothetical protein